MKRFLYQPILRAIAAREQLIAAQLADAAEQKAEAQRERVEFEAKNQAYEAQRATLLGEAVAQVQVERQRLLDSARQAAEAMSAKRQEALRNDVDNLNQALAQRVQAEVFAIARKALADLADSSLEDRLVAAFVEQLQGLEAPAQQRLAEAIALGTEPVLLRCVFELPGAQRQLLQEALNNCFDGEITLRFERKAELLGGIELSCNGQRLAWSISDYLQALEQGVDELLQAKTTAAAQP
jgi:F-type H+-transporting ATPase subunit b